MQNMKFIDRFRKFMRGRYGVDELYKFLMYVYIILVIINLYIKSSIISFVELLIFFIMFYRFFSRKIYKRSNENVLFIKYKKKLCRKK